MPKPSDRTTERLGGSYDKRESIYERPSGVRSGSSVVQLGAGELDFLHPRVLDFGIAKAAGEAKATTGAAAEPEPAGEGTLFTMAGACTPPYAPP